MIRIRPLLRQAAYRSGGLGLMRERLRGALTVVMFHRVLDPADPDFADADPSLTVPANLFDDMLGFFHDHYEVVSLADVMAAREGTRALPEHALLISFDDGWADNLRYAAPRLKARRLPAVIFVAAEAVLSSDEAWWHDQIFAAERRGALHQGLTAMRGGVTESITDSTYVAEPLELVCHLANVTDTERTEILAAIGGPKPAARMMLAPDDIKRLSTFGIALGIHGYSHVPLTRVDDVNGELRRARSAVTSMSGDAASAAALACPHGRYDERVLRMAKDAGIRLVFTSDPVLNPTDHGMLAQDRPLGRISMEVEHLADDRGRLDCSAAAAWLWRHPLPASGAE